MNRVIQLLLIVLVFASCEKNVDFKLNNVEDKLVVEAEIENNQYPFVILTKSTGYFKNLSPELLANTFVHNATVTISNGNQSHQLREYAYPITPLFSVYAYTIDSSNMSTAFKGELNKRYFLNIAADGKTYTSNVLIPGFYATLDSMWTAKVPNISDTNLRKLMIRSTDPPGRGQYVRYFTKRNSGLYLPGENSVFDDQVIDGTTFTIQIDQGIDKNNPPKADSNYFHKGDTITMKFCNIEKPVYDFWSTWEFAFQGIGNPFSQPNKVISNINGGALGVFSGYAARYKTIIAQ